MGMGGDGNLAMKKNLRVSTIFFLRNAITLERQFASQNHEFFVYFKISKVGVFQTDKMSNRNLPVFSPHLIFEIFLFLNLKRHIYIYIYMYIYIYEYIYKLK